MKKFDVKKIIYDKMAALLTKTFFRLVLNELIHEKTCFCICLWTLYSDIIFFIGITVRGVSNKHFLLPFYILIGPIQFRLHTEMNIYVCKCL